MNELQLFFYIHLFINELNDWNYFFDIIADY